MTIFNLSTSSCVLEDTGIPLGRDIMTEEEIALALDLLKTHLHVIGTTGTGKTRFLLHLFRHLVQIPNATVIVIDPKGGLFEMARDGAMAGGLTKRLVLFDPQQTDVVCGYNPLFPNGLPLGSHTKLVREGIEAGWGQSSLDFGLTPQLHRFLYLALYAVRELELTLIEALDILRPASHLRKAILPRIQDRHVKSALVYLDNMPERRQAELVSSSEARLEAFCLDPQIRRIFTPQRKTLSLEEVMRKNQILLVNLSKGRPLRRDDVFLIGRLIVNDIVNHAMERPAHRRTPLFLIIDECQNVATPDLCDALDEGRELQTHCVLAHQFLAQLQEEERSGYLYHSVMNDARTRVVFGGSAPEDLDVLVPRIFLDQLTPWALKDEIKVPIFAPVESTRVVRTTGRSRSQGRGLSLPYAEAEGESTTVTGGITESASYGESESDSKAFTKGTSKGTSLERSIGQTMTDSWAETIAESENWSEGESEGESVSSSESHSSSSGTNSAFDLGIAIDGEGDATRSFNYGMGWNSQSGVARNTGRSAFTFSSRTHGGSPAEAKTWGGSEARSISSSLGEQRTESESETIGKTTGTNRNFGLSLSQSLGKTTSKTVTKGITPSVSEEESESESETVTPFMEYHREILTSSRTYLSLEEQKLLLAQKLEAQPIAHCVIKAPIDPARFLKLLYIETPWISTRMRERNHRRIWTEKPYYSTDIEIEAEEQQRARRLALPPSLSTVPTSQPFEQPNHSDVQYENDQGDTAHEHTTELTEPKSWGDTRKPRIPISARGRRKTKTDSSDSTRSRNS